MRAILSSIYKRFFLVAVTAMLIVNSVQANEFSLEKFGTDNAVWIGLVFIIVEYILGKTTLVKSGSTLELVINTILGLLKKFFGPKTSILKG